MVLCRMRASFLDQLEAWKVELTIKTEEIVAGKVGDCWVWHSCEGSGRERSRGKEKREEGEKEGGVRRQREGEEGEKGVEGGRSEKTGREKRDRGGRIGREGGKEEQLKSKTRLW